MCIDFKSQASSHFVDTETWFLNSSDASSLMSTPGGSLGGSPRSTNRRLDDESLPTRIAASVRAFAAFQRLAFTAAGAAAVIFDLKTLSCF